MRTKTLLLSAAALLTAGIVSSQAQAPVYSQNVVGYATVQLPSSYVLMTVPFNVGVSNGANEVFGASLPDQSDLLLWDQAHGKFITDVYDTGAGFNTPPYWFMSDDSTPTNPPILAPGQGFFLVAPGGATNTFAGAVAVNVGGTNTATLPSAYSLLGSVIPAGTSVTNGTIINLGPGLPDQTDVLIWDQQHAKFITDVYDTGAGFNTPPYWFMSDDSTPTNPPVLGVGQAFFIVAPGGGTWQEIMPSN